MFLVLIFLWIPFSSFAGMEDTIRFLTHNVHPAYQLNGRDIKFAKTSIEKGLNLIPEILQNTYSFENASNMTRLKDILALSWGLFHLATEKGYGFDQGMLMIEDPNGCIFQFLLKSQSAYSRISHHYDFANPDLKVKQYGIDFLGHMPNTGEWIIRERKNKFFQFFNHTLNPLFLLPTKKSHILFGQLPKGAHLALDTSYLFFRLEDYGLSTLKNLAEHMKDYVSIHTKYFYQNRMINGYYLRSERVAPELVDLYIQLLKERNETSHESPVFYLQERQKAMDLGIRYVYKEVRHMKFHVPLSENLQLLIHKMFLHFNYLDQLEARTSTEVVLSYQELLQNEASARYE